MIDRLPTVSPQRFRVVAAWVFAVFVVIVFTGSAVRVTGSGLGCPSWPKCTEETVYSTSTDTPVLIEFGNRVITVLISLLVGFALVAAWRRRPYRKDLLVLAGACLFAVGLQTFVGGMSVVYHLAPGIVMSHYGLSMLAIIVAYLLYFRAREEPWAGQVRNAREVVLAVRALLVVGGVAIFAGTAATAAGPHGGGGGTGDTVTRLYFKGEDTLSFVVQGHGVLTGLLGVFAVVTWWLARRAGVTRDLMRTLTVVCVMLGVQGALGIVQYRSELPEALVWIHVILATLTWVGLVRAWFYAGLPAEPDAPIELPAALDAERTARTVTSSSYSGSFSASSDGSSSSAA